jgi:hypothetical protein
MYNGTITLLYFLKAVLILRKVREIFSSMLLAVGVLKVTQRNREANSLSTSYKMTAFYGTQSYIIVRLYFSVMLWI